MSTAIMLAEGNVNFFLLDACQLDSVSGVEWMRNLISLSVSQCRPFDSTKCYATIKCVFVKFRHIAAFQLGLFGQGRVYTDPKVPHV